MIERLLPPAVSGAEAFEDPPGVELFPAEQALLTRAVTKRRLEFATGRDCAHRALAALGVVPAAILRGERGDPQWPPGIVGSITHCAGYRAAAVARARDVLTVGLDAEPADALPDDVLGHISLPAERARLRDLVAAAPGVAWDRLLFSAKEATFKAWYPVQRRWLGFEDAEITVHQADGTFEARLLVPPPTVRGAPLTGFAGRWLVRDGLILTAIFLAVDGRALTAGDSGR